MIKPAHLYAYIIALCASEMERSYPQHEQWVAFGPNHMMALKLNANGTWELSPLNAAQRMSRRMAFDAASGWNARLSFRQVQEGETVALMPALDAYRELKRYAQEAVDAIERR